MKKLLFILFLINSSLSFAHPPADMKVAYFLEENAIRIDVRHITVNNQEHFVDEVGVKFWYSQNAGYKEGRYLSEDFCSQDSNFRNHYIVNLGAEQILLNSEVEITVYCSSIGAIKGTFYFDGEKLLKKGKEEVIWVFDNPESGNDCN